MLLPTCEKRIFELLQDYLGLPWWRFLKRWEGRVLIAAHMQARSILLRQVSMEHMIQDRAMLQARQKMLTPEASKKGTH